MQYFTPQEMAGGVRYGGKCKVGNWNENATLDEIRAQEYLAKKRAGTLKTDQYNARMAKALAPVTLTPPSDAERSVRFGDIVMLANVASGAAVAADVEDADARGDELACAVSASTRPAPAARNTWSFEKYAPRASAFLTPTWDDDLVRYGQKVKIVLNAAAGAISGAASGAAANDAAETKNRLRSYAVSTTRFAKRSRFCEVAVSAFDSYECVFEILTPDPTKRLVSEGVPVSAGAPVVIRHCQTNQCLSVPGPAFANDFGDELEVAGNTASGAGNAYVMQGLATGKPDSMTTKAPGDVNAFIIVAGER